MEKTDTESKNTENIPVIKDNPASFEPIAVQTMSSFQYNMSVSRVSSSPLPSPELLEQYKKTIPDAAERILRMVEKQQEHRINLETTLLETKIKLSIRGQIIAAVLAVLALFVIGISVYIGYPGVASLIAVFTGGVVISAFLGNRKKEKEKVNNTATDLDKTN